MALRLIRTDRSAASRSPPRQREVLALLDQPDDEGLMRIEVGRRFAARASGASSPGLRPDNPADRIRNPDPEPRRRLSRRHAFIRVFRTAIEYIRSVLLPSVHLHRGGS